VQAELTAVAHELVTGVEPGFDHLTLRALSRQVISGKAG
jgi:hypothetical protein